MLSKLILTLEVPKLFLNWMSTPPQPVRCVLTSARVNRALDTSLRQWELDETVVPFNFSPSPFQWCLLILQSHQAGESQTRPWLSKAPGPLP